MITLYQHQKEGRDRLLKYKKYCLFFEVGTGKTFTALDALTHLKPCKVLIVAPKRVLDNVWKTDAHYNLKPYDVTYLNYEKISRDKSFISNRYDVIILDEVHRIKGATTKIGKKIRFVSQYAEYVWGLTGTPIANNYADVYNIFKNMNIDEFDMSYDEFVYNFYNVKLLDTKTGFRVPILVAPKSYRLDELMERIGKHSMVKEAKDCIDLPESRTNVIVIDGMNTDKYREIEKGIIKTDLHEKTCISLEALNKAHQAANGFIYDVDGSSYILGDNNKLKQLKLILEDMLEETKQVIIVYNFKEDLNQLKSLEYDWTTDPQEFPNKQILFLQFAQSEGLNLQYCNQMIFYSYDYSYLNYTQMCGRILRNGQKNNVTYHFLVSKGTIEVKIWWAIKNKKSRDEFLKETIGGFDG